MATNAYGNPVPRYINSPQTNPGNNRPVDTGKRLALIAGIPALEPGVLYTVASAPALRRLDPSSSDLALYEKLIYDCAPTDNQVRNKPSVLYLVNTLPSTQAGLTLVDGAPQATLRLDSRRWGAVGNRIKVVVASGSNQGKKYTLTAPNVATEVYDDVGGGTIVQFNYTGSQNTTTTMAFDQTTGLRISYTRTAIAISTITPTQMSFDGIITYTPSAAPVGGAYTVTTTGVNKATGAPAVDVLTWPDGLGAAAKPTAIGFSSVTSVLFATTIGVPTFSMAGYAFDLDPADAPTASELVALVDPTLGAGTRGYIATILSPTASGLATGLLDTFASATIQAAAKNLTADVNAAVVALGASGIVEVERSSGADGAPSSGTFMLAGGANGSDDGTTNTAGWTAALAATQNIAATTMILWLGTTSATYHALALTYMNEMAAAGGKARQMHLGAADNETLSQLNTRILALNNYDIQLWFQGFTRLSPTGVSTAYSAMLLALQSAAIQASMAVGFPQTYKRPNILDYSQNAAIDPNTDAAVLINAGLSFVATVDNLIQNVRPMTTYLVGDNLFYEEPGCVESLQAHVNDIHLACQAARAVGSPNILFDESSFEQIITQRANKHLSAETRFIKAWEATSLIVETVDGDWLRGTWNVQPIQGINFVETRPVTILVPTR